ncbi:MAG TPA: hypothetical protein VFQ51_10640 [Vicinamibacteria bacterium]|nr:hypothetical protein [Vicinamibacteria bacterium]
MSARAAKRREITMMWMKQLLEAQEKQGTAKAAAAAWIGTVYALRAASRIDGNADWGKVGDEMIGNLESVYLELFGKEGEKAIEAGRRLLQTHEKPQLTIAKIPKVKKPAAIKRPTLRKPLFKRPLMSRAAALRKIEAAKAAVAKPKAAASKAKAAKAKAAKKGGKGKKGKKGKR